MSHKVQAKKIMLAITKSNWGGAQKYVYDLAVELKRQDSRVQVLLGGNGTLKDALEKEEIETFSLPEMERDISLVKDIKTFFSFLKTVKREMPDVLHLNSPKASGIGSVVGSLVGTKKIIMTVHGWSFNEDRNYFQKIIIKFFSWLTMLFCHKVIVLSEKEKEQVSNWPFIKNKLEIIPTSIKPFDLLSNEDARDFLISIDNNLEKYKNNIWIGTIAELNKNKGLNFVLDALKNEEVSKNIIYIVIGDGEQEDNLKKQIIKNNLVEKVFLMGHLENASQYLSAFDLFLISSIKEGLPYSLLEAGYARLPVISTNVGGIPEIIKQEENGVLIEPSNSTEIEKSIVSFLNDTEKYKKMGQSLFQKIEKAFLFENIAKKIIALYN